MLYATRKTENHNFDKRFRLDMACANDQLRPSFGFVHFIGGYAYATDAHIMVRAKIADISDFRPDEIEMICGKNGNSISMSAFRRIIQFRNVNVSEEGFLHKSDDGDVQQLFKFHAIDEQRKIQLSIFHNDDKYGVPRMDEIIDVERKPYMISEFGLNAQSLKYLSDAMGSERLAFFFIEAGHQIIVKPIDEDLKPLDIIGVFMPVLID